MPASMLETLVAQRGATGVLFPPLNLAQVFPGPSVRLISLNVLGKTLLSASDWQFRSRLSDVSTEQFLHDDV